ncbi:hypothetical protein [Rhodococcus sp. NPDC059234]|uniref:hypothetical protein n=1 Tax=Rhodococcus sp. NPDC059234 TaxID=3346781 RepID=UPI00367095E7
MRIPLWIGGPALVALATVDAALMIPVRSVGSLTRAVIRGMGTEILEPWPIDVAAVSRTQPFDVADNAVAEAR